MISLFLALLFPLCFSVDPAKLVWQPNLVTKESILADYLKLDTQPAINTTKTLAYVTTWNARGFMLARKTARRLSFLSPAWFQVAPVYEAGILVNMEILRKIS
ncbi:unnamed protein product [Caenorhabditis sp. 36 PRJEB53466]|nr:unnamed protein product [Caenorhabditis sp. 36 PRJEB53466]